MYFLLQRQPDLLVQWLSLIRKVGCLTKEFFLFHIFAISFLKLILYLNQTTDVREMMMGVTVCFYWCVGVGALKNDSVGPMLLMIYIYNHHQKQVKYTLTMVPFRCIKIWFCIFCMHLHTKLSSRPNQTTFFLISLPFYLALHVITSVEQHHSISGGDTVFSHHHGSNEIRFFCLNEFWNEFSSCRSWASIELPQHTIFTWNSPLSSIIMTAATATAQQQSNNRATTFWFISQFDVAVQIVADACKRNMHTHSLSLAFVMPILLNLSIRAQFV